MDKTDFNVRDPDPTPKETFSKMSARNQRRLDRKEDLKDQRRVRAERRRKARLGSKKV